MHFTDNCPVLMWWVTYRIVFITHPCSKRGQCSKNVYRCTTKHTYKLVWIKTTSGTARSQLRESTELMKEYIVYDEVLEMYFPRRCYLSCSVFYFTTSHIFSKERFTWWIFRSDLLLLFISSRCLQFFLWLIHEFFLFISFIKRFLWDIYHASIIIMSNIHSQLVRKYNHSSEIQSYKKYIITGIHNGNKIFIYDNNIYSNWTRAVPK